MKSRDYCKNIINGLSFHQDNVRLCVTNQMGPIISTYSESPKELAEKIINLKKNVLINVPSECENCIFTNKEPVISDKITRIDIFYWYHCNCGCFYCVYKEETKGEYSDRVKKGNSKVYATIKELYKRDAISRDSLRVVFGGGEIGVLKEFPKLIDLFLKNGVEQIWCETSGIKHLKAIDKILMRGKGGLSIAICSGSREVYKKIKRRDKYPQVILTFKKYVKAANKNKSRGSNISNVISKFIILQGFNNNKEEIDKWLSDAKNIGLTNVELSMEFCWGTKTKTGQKIEDYNYELFRYTEDRCKELGLTLIKNETSVALMKQGVY